MSVGNDAVKLAIRGGGGMLDSAEKQSNKLSIYFFATSCTCHTSVKPLGRPSALVNYGVLVVSHI